MALETAQQHGERLARIEEQIVQLRADSQANREINHRENAEIKSSISQLISTAEGQSERFMAAISDLSKNHPTNTEIRLMAEGRDRSEKDLADRVEELESQVAKLRTWRAWLTGALGALLAIAYAAFDYLHQWISGGGKP